MNELTYEKKYKPGRVIDRKEIFQRIFKGEELTHDDMFKTRGYRGLNFLPYPDHVKKQANLRLTNSA